LAGLLLVGALGWPDGNALSFPIGSAPRVGVAPTLVLEPGEMANAPLSYATPDDEGIRRVIEIANYDLEPRKYSYFVRYGKEAVVTLPGRSVGVIDCTRCKERLEIKVYNSIVATESQLYSVPVSRSFKLYRDRSSGTVILGSDELAFLRRAAK
jgi:hypothetical protein